MSRTLTKLTTFTAVLCCAIPAWADNDTNDDDFYVGAALGIVDGSDTTASGTSGGTVKFDTATMGAFFVGKRFDANWRGEAEVARRNLNLSSVSNATASGDVQATSLMGNALYDVDMDGSLKPYIGAGVGFAKVQLNNTSPFGGSTINDSDTAPAFQAIAGAGYALNPTLDLFADYRYFTTADASYTTAAGASTSMDFSTHSVMAGLRFRFGEDNNHVSDGGQSDGGQSDNASQSMRAASTEPSTMVAKNDLAPQTSMPSRTLPETYMVHFVLNKADVSREGISVIERAAANAKSMNVTRLILTGHTDRAGDQAYNQGLSKRRAEAVKTAFVALGFNKDEITVKAKGETNLLVPTNDGKHEPKNRRVEIVLP